MRLILVLLILAGACFPAPSQTVSIRPKIGLALSGGGARGFAHIGVLKVLDSLHIPVDYIAGTSMGGLIGGLYAIGYSAVELEKIARETQWDILFNDQPSRTVLPYAEKKETGRYQLVLGLRDLDILLPTGLIRGQKITQMLSRLTYAYANVNKFDRLPIPFRCVSVDLLHARKVVHKKGNLAQALRATMSLPTIFYPVEWGDSLLIDGGLLDNLPVDVVRSMGADIVIAVDVGKKSQSKKDLQTLVDILEQTFSLANVPQQEWAEQNSDLLLTPPLGDYSHTDFDPSSIRRAIHTGSRIARDSLKALLQLRHITDPAHMADKHIPTADSTRLHSIQIAGNTTIPFTLIDSLLDLKNGQLFNEDTLKAHLFRLRTTGWFKQIHTSINAMDSLHYRVTVFVKEKNKPRIARVNIQGQKRLSFTFIYNLLGIKPGTVFDPYLVDDRITQLYSLGYFETISYNIVPVSHDRIALNFKIQEKPRRELRVGFQYDNLYQLTMAVSVQGTNIFIPGLRMENELIFPQRLQWRYKAFYPSRSLNYPVYPFLQTEYRDFPIKLFDEQAREAGRFSYRSLQWAVGLGIQTGKFINAELAFNNEYMKIEPNTAISDPLLLPGYKPLLRTGRLHINLDYLDDILLPTRGVWLEAQYEGAFAKLLSKDRYFRFQVSGHLYGSLSSKLIWHGYGFYGQISRDTPLYKNFYLGGPDDFAGLDYHQLTGQKVVVARLDVRHQWSKIWHGGVILNTAYAELLRNNQAVAGFGKWIYGAGVFLIYATPFGPFQVTYAGNFNSFYRNQAGKTFFYIKAGYHF